MISSLFKFRACKKNSLIPPSDSDGRGLFLPASGVLVSMLSDFSGDLKVSVLVMDSPSLKLRSRSVVVAVLDPAAPAACVGFWILSMPVPVSLDCVSAGCGVLFIMLPSFFPAPRFQACSTCATVASRSGPSETLQPESKPSRTSRVLDRVSHR